MYSVFVLIKRDHARPTKIYSFCAAKSTFCAARMNFIVITANYKKYRPKQLVLRAVKNLQSIVVVFVNSRRGV